MTLRPKFESTYEEYCWLRLQFGYDPDGAMFAVVWNGCTPESQENMLEQLRRPLQHANRYVETHGEAW